MVDGFREQAGPHYVVLVLINMWQSFMALLWLWLLLGTRWRSTVGREKENEGRRREMSWAYRKRRERGGWHHTHLSKLLVLMCFSQLPAREGDLSVDAEEERSLTMSSPTEEAEVVLVNNRFLFLVSFSNSKSI